MKILVVEDTLDTREMLKFYLSIEGFNVIAAEDGQDGVEKAEKEKPRLVLTDLSMPRMNGIELIKYLRQHPELSDVKIIALTAYGSGNARAASAAGANLVLRKPADFDSLSEIIKNLLDG